MSRDKEQRNEGIVPARDGELRKYSADLIQRGLDLTQELRQSDTAVDVDQQSTEIVTKKRGAWRCLHTLNGHSDFVYSVAISPNGKTIVSGSKDRNIKVWDLQTGQMQRTLEGHSSLVKSVAISPDGQTIVSGSLDSTIKMWDLHTGQMQRSLKGHSWQVHSVAISPNGQTIVSGGLDIGGSKDIKVWDLHTGQLIRTLKGHLSLVTSVAISPDGQTIVSDSRDKILKVWNLQTESLIGNHNGYSAR